MRTQFLGVIMSETDRMSRIVQDLLTLSRFDYGRIDIKMEQFSFIDAVKKVFEAVGMDVKRHAQQITLEVSGRLPRVRGDRSRIEQVIMNVVSNAVKYTPDGGHIALKTWEDGDRVCLSVTDDGIGIPEKDIPRLFERFYRVDKAPLAGSPAVRASAFRSRLRSCSSTAGRSISKAVSTKARA